MVNIVVYGVVDGLKLFMSFLCIRITFVHGVVLQLILFLVFFTLSRTLLKVTRSVPFRVHVIAISLNSTTFNFYLNDGA